MGKIYKILELESENRELKKRMEKMETNQTDFSILFKKLIVSKEFLNLKTENAKLHWLVVKLLSK